MDKTVEENNSIENTPQMPRLKPLNSNKSSENIPNETNIYVEPQEALKQDVSVVNSQDILHMDIIFDNTDAENQMDNVAAITPDFSREADPQNLSSQIVDMEIDFDCGNTINEVEEGNSCDVGYIGSECTGLQVIKHDNVATNGQDYEEIISESQVKTDLCHDEQTCSIDFEGNLSSLVVVAREDPLDSNNVIHEVFLMSPDTGIMSDEPLDLPPEIIDRIKTSLLEGSF